MTTYFFSACRREERVTTPNYISNTRIKTACTKYQVTIELQTGNDNKYISRTRADELKVFPNTSELEIIGGIYVHRSNSGLHTFIVAGKINGDTAESPLYVF